MTYNNKQGQSELRFSRSNSERTTAFRTHEGSHPLMDPPINNARLLEKYTLSKEYASFVICKNCIRCASYLSSNLFGAENCSNCSLDMLEAIPLESNEKFKVGYDQKRGLTLEFSI